MDDAGLRNLWALSTEGYRDPGWYGKPRIDWDTLQRLNGGLAASTACLGGPLLEPYLAGNEQLALANLAGWRTFSTTGCSSRSTPTTSTTRSAATRG